MTDHVRTLKARVNELWESGAADDSIRLWDEYTERAGIMEYEAHMPRDTAEQKAAADVLGVSAEGVAG